MAKNKNKKLKTATPAARRKQPPNKPQHSKPKLPPSATTTTTTTSNAPKKQPQHKQPQHTAPTIPFTPYSTILLVGEGDLSFAASLVSHHGCAFLTATTYDSREEVLAKYPQAAAHMAAIESEEQRVICGVDATKLGVRRELRRPPAESGGDGEGAGKKGGKEGWDVIMFNFPHVGGKSTDVNRQVRYNQEMLVGFFSAAKPLLAAPEGTIVVTLFEGEPYTLWNIRDLARHVGLEVQESFRFQAGAYPGYSHARTLGNIEGGGGWKGEERAARSFVFRVKDEGRQGQQQGKKQRSQKMGKRKRDEDSSDDDDG